MCILKIIYIILVIAIFFQESIAASLTHKWIYPQPWYFYAAIRGAGDVVCGGTFIRKNWLLTTASCVEECCINTKVSKVTLTTYFTRESFYGTNSTPIPAKIFKHEQFTKFYHEQFHFNDIALIKVNTTTWNLGKQISTFPLSDIAVKPTEECEFPSFTDGTATQFGNVNLSAKFFDCNHFQTFKHPNLQARDKTIMLSPDFCTKYGFVDLTMYNLPVWNIYGRGHPLMCNNKVYGLIMSNLVKNRGADDPLVGSQWTFTTPYLPWISGIISANEEVYYSQPNSSKPPNTPAKYTGSTPLGPSGGAGQSGGSDTGGADIEVKSSAIDHFSQIGFLKALFYFTCVLLTPIIFKMN